MKQITTLFAFMIMIMILNVNAQNASNNNLAPLLDRALFFGDPQITGGQLSPDGKFISFIKPYNGTRNVWVKRVEESFESAKPLTNDPKRPIPGYFWSRDSKRILFVQDKGGNENFHVYAVDPTGKPTEEGVPESKAITSGDKVLSLIHI